MTRRGPGSSPADPLAAAPTRALPNFLVIGAQRSGTTLLHRLLEAHPQVYVPTRRKEIHFFDRHHQRGARWYGAFFPAIDAAKGLVAIGEATPDYLATPEVAGRIHRLLPDCRLIAVLRSPIARAYSWYQYSRRSHGEERDLELFLSQDPTALDWGLYARHLERYLGLFPRSQLLILIYEELLAEPERELLRLRSFLGLDPDLAWPGARQLMAERVNTSSPPRFHRSFALARRLGSWLTRRDLDVAVRLAKRAGLRRLFGKGPPAALMSAATRQRLAGFYADDVARLTALLGRDQPVWRL